MSQVKDQPARAAGHARKPMTIGGIMLAVLIVALYLALWRSRFIKSSASTISGLVVLFWASLVFGIKQNQWLAADFIFEEIDLFDDRTPEPVRALLHEMGPQIEALRFTNLGLFLRRNQVPNAVSYVALFEHRPKRQIAEFAYIIARAPGVQKIVTTLFLTTEFTDETRLVTTNSRVPKLTPNARLRKGSMSFPNVRDPARLHAIHNACIARYAGDAIRVEHDTSDPAEFLSDKSRKDVARMAETGYFYLDEKNRLYRYSWKGAIMAVIKLTWPVKPVRACLRRRKAARLLRELGLEGDGGPSKPWPDESPGL